MTEYEYIKVSNKAHLQCASDCLRHVMEGADYGVNTDIYSTAVVAVNELLDSLFASIEIQESDCE